MAIFDETTGGPIPLEEAIQWTKNYRDKHKEPGEIRAHAFGSNIIKEVMGQPGCVGMRIYYALDDKDNKHLLLVGIDKDGNDQIPSNDQTKTSSSGGVVGDRSTNCPPDCAVNSPLFA